MIKKLFTNDLYIKVYTNRFEIKNISTNSEWISILPDESFTTNRLLVGKFSAAEPPLQQGVKSLLPSLIPKSPQAVVQPMEMIEGGICEVEERIFKELVLGSGAFKVLIHVGAVLTDDQVSDMLANA